MRRLVEAFMALSILGNAVPAMAQQVPVSGQSQAAARMDGQTLLSSRGAFLGYMASLNAQQRQNIMNQLMTIDADALTRMVYADGDRGALYEREYDRALAQNPRFFKDKFTTLVQEMNINHEQPDVVRFFMADRSSAVRLYDMMTQGWPEPYTSTFQGLFHRFQQKSRAEGVSLFSILDAYPGRTEKLADFLDAVSIYEFSDELWASLRSDEQTRLINVLFENVNKDNNNRYVYTVAEFMRALPANSPAHTLIEQKIRAGYEAGSGHRKDVYGVLARWYAEVSPHRISTQNQNFFAGIEGDPRFALHRPDGIGAEDMFDAQGRNFQIHIFYNDDDGKNSYNGFIDRMSSNGWSMRGQGSGITELRKNMNGRSVIAYVSEPFANGEAVPTIRQRIAAQGGKASVLVQRGHSYYVADAARHIDQDIKLGFFGACGVSVASEEGARLFSNMQIVGSAGVGRGVINNASILFINNQLLSNGAVSWDAMEQFWISQNSGEAYFTPKNNAAQVLYKTLTKLKDRAPALSFNTMPYNYSVTYSPEMAA